MFSERQCAESYSDKNDTNDDSNDKEKKILVIHIK